MIGEVTTQTKVIVKARSFLEFYWQADEKFQRVHYVSADKYILNYIEQTCDNTNAVFYFGQSGVHQSPSTNSGIYIASTWNNKSNILVFCFSTFCVYWTAKLNNSWSKWHCPGNIVDVDNPVT